MKLAAAYARGEIVWNKVQAETKRLIESGEAKTVTTVQGYTTDRTTVVNIEIPPKERADLVVFMRNCTNRDKIDAIANVAKCSNKRKRVEEVLPDAVLLLDEEEAKSKKLRLTNKVQDSMRIGFANDELITQEKTCSECKRSKKMKAFAGSQLMARKGDIEGFKYYTVKEICHLCVSKRNTRDRACHESVNLNT